MDALDKLTNDVNRKILQITMDQGEMDVKKLHGLFDEHRGISYLQFVGKIHNMAKSSLLETIMSDDGRTIERIRLTTFGDVLLRSLFVAQKLLEAKHG